MTAGLVAASAVGAQVPGAAGRAFQVSMGAGTATAQVVTGESNPNERGSIRPLTGTLLVGTGIGDRFVVGLDMFWSYLPQKTNYSPGRNAESNIHSLSVLAKFYPVRRGFFVDLGLGWATADFDMARAGGSSSYGRFLARGAALRYGVGYDVPVRWGVSFTPYIAGMFMAKPFESRYTCECVYTLDNGVSWGAPGAGLPGWPYPPTGASPIVNVLHVGVGLTYALHSAPKRRP